MPGWHDQTQQLQESGDIQMVGIIQEQHPARAQLFMQWQEMGWPVMVDSLDLLGVKVVPITLLIDEHGIVRSKGSQDDLEAFLKTEYPVPSGSNPKPVAFPDLPETPTSAEDWRELADSLILRGQTSDLERAITGYRKALEAEPGDGSTHFRLGVAYRKRYDSDHRQEGDFRQAVENWGAALDADPNQYIWRRRIQQYGPRLEKPYPFYDWVETARSEIAARGERPVALPVDPRGAEIAQPVKNFTADSGGEVSPDAEGRIRRDERGFVRLEQTLVPASVAPGDTIRAHLAFRPATHIEAHWNNEAEDLEVWLDPPAGWRVDRRRLSVPNPPELVSDEARRLELEIETPADFEGSATVPGYALYYVCEDVKGTCLYRRQDFALKVRVSD